MENEPKGVLVHKVVSGFAVAICPSPNPTLYGVHFFPASPFIHSSLTVKVPMNIVCVG